MTHQEALEREAYLKKTMEENPDYAGVLPLFIAICEHVRENPGASGASFTLPENAEERVRSGAPALTPDDLRVETAAARTYLQGLAERLLAVGIGEADQFRKFRYISEQEMPKLLVAWLEGRRGTIQSTAFRLGVNPGVLESLLAVPVKEAAAAAAAEVPAEWHEGWERLTCPVCGSEPAMGELQGEDKRIVCCGVCRTEWSLPTVSCAHCGNNEPESLTHFIIEGDFVRVDLCEKCGRYLKTRDLRLGGDDVALDLLDVTTMHLDLIADRHGFSRK